MNVIQMVFEIVFTIDGMFPKSPLPYRGFALLLPGDAPLFTRTNLLYITFGKCMLDLFPPG